MIPLKSEVPVFSRPLVTWALMAINVGVYLWMHSQGEVGFQQAVVHHAAIPRNVMGGDVAVLMYRGDMVAALVDGSEVVPYATGPMAGRVVVLDTPEGPRFYFRSPLGTLPLEVVRQRTSPWLTLLTAMFMHAGLLHLAGNMWFLFVFGPSLEDSLGKLAYLLFYLLTGFGATAAQLAHDPGSTIPFLGASGAIAGVMGGFAVRFPGANVLTLIPIVLYTLAHLPAWIFMLIYIGEQIFMSVVHSEQNGGVAWWAHVGGFATGYAAIRVFPIRGPWREILRRRDERSDLP